MGPSGTHKMSYCTNFCKISHCSNSFLRVKHYKKCEKGLRRMREGCEKGVRRVREGCEKGTRRVQEGCEKRVRRGVRRG